MATSELPAPRQTLSYVRDLLHDRLIFKLNRMYFLWITLGLLLPAVAEGLITMSWLGFARGPRLKYRYRVG
jgi:hypothetical protein